MRPPARLPVGPAFLIVRPPLPHFHRSNARDAGVLVIDEQALVRAGLCTLLRATPGLRVVGEAEDVRGACAVARKQAPDVVLLDRRALDDGAAALPALRREVPRACVLVMGGEAVARAAGVHGCLSANAGVDELCAAVAAHLSGGCGVCAVRPWCAVPRVASTLTPRERQVAIRVAAGRTSKEIAADLGVSRRTVDTYREALARKLGASSAAAVTRWVIETGLTEAASA